MFEKAVITATMAHKGQNRKGTAIPYIFHPLEVGYILAAEECAEPLIIAGILHDTLEDTQMTAHAIQDLFGKQILELVLGASEANRNSENVTWQQRKQHTLDYLANEAPQDVKLIACADKLSNIRSIERDCTRRDFWQRFNAGYDKQSWYYNGLVKSMASLMQTMMYQEFVTRVHTVFNKTAGAGR